ncbi:hypothetical protein GCM10023115_11990 [Pontixanthobacter gangjinensis]|uniref:Tetratricopeptide repeat protein n=1 Tax=Pontixanthobacter gangjinensis TaxID=1028742 RepID=A0A6I4SLB2_9SPHN|nr:SPOR domain-containing protein [Pontixanthobacter gangjinensis]MXO56444.1 tetratricopeptide repeat protein [Pontixanthobacter gangjinensis]
MAQSAESPVSQAVVQPLPPAGVSELNSALRRLAANSRDVNALVDAGNASIKVNDIDAAIGFFGRAEELSPGNARVKIGLAAAYVRKQRPLDALQLFDEAERAGASAGNLSGERGLAYDLVGDNGSAQFHYQQALRLKDEDELRRRLALSYAMAGDRNEFEKTLYPLIVKEDFASYRTRAFGLAILGEEAEAIAITEAVMPRNLSARIAPYLRYLPRLTKAQQAAAANLGIFPRAAQIGRDAPQIAQYAGSEAAARSADARLTPQGEPLGRREDSTSQRRRPDRGRSAVEQAAKPVDAKPAPSTAQADADTPSRSSRPSLASISDPLARTRAPQRIRVRKSEVAKPEDPPIEDSPPAQASIAVQSGPETSAGTSRPATSSRAEPVAALIARTDGELTTTAAIDEPGFDLARVGQSGSTVPAQALAKPAPADAPTTVADAFASFTLEPTTGPAMKPGVVDILSIEPPREVARKPEPKLAAEPKPPANPRRYWVQVATGRDRSALKFDWRRISRKTPDILGDKSSFVAGWGQTNRLLAGPYSSSREAQSAVSELKAKDVDSFTFTSAEGEEVEPLK